MVIYLEFRSPGISSDLPETERATPRSLLLSLAPNGVYQADKSPCRWCALTAPFHPYLYIAKAVCFLWHYSLRSPSLAVSKHPALWSPDFPQPCGRDRSPRITSGDKSQRSFKPCRECDRTSCTQQCSEVCRPPHCGHWPGRADQRSEAEPCDSRRTHDQDR